MFLAMINEPPADAFILLTTDPPDFSVEHASELLRQQYGLQGSLEPQDSERDQNFLLRTKAGDKFVLKIANSAEPESITGFQIAALIHLQKSQVAARVPKVVRTIDGQTRIRVSADDGQIHTARVLSWLPGRPLRPDAISAVGLNRMGETLALLGRALRDFEHPASDYPLLWDIKQARLLRELLDTVADEALRSMLARHLDRFDAEAAPRLEGLRWQVIHNDLNPGNVLFDTDDENVIAGIIDFGDMIRSPLVVDVAVGCAYLRRGDDGSTTGLLEFLRGYSAVTPLTSDEFAVLPYLVKVRNVSTVVISHWRASLYPENRAYILRSADRALHMLNTFGRRPPSELAREMQDYCERNH
jgi:hydroxylysine kinase